VTGHDLVNGERHVSRPIGSAFLLLTGASSREDVVMASEPAGPGSRRAPEDRKPERVGRSRMRADGTSARDSVGMVRRRLRDLSSTVQVTGASAYKRGTALAYLVIESSTARAAFALGGARARDR